MSGRHPTAGARPTADGLLPRTRRVGHHTEVLGRLPVAVPIVVALGAIVLIVFGNRFVFIAGMLLLGLAIAVAVIKRSPDPLEPQDDDRR